MFWFNYLDHNFNLKEAIIIIIIKRGKNNVFWHFTCRIIQMVKILIMLHVQNSISTIHEVICRYCNHISNSRKREKSTASTVDPTSKRHIHHFYYVVELNGSWELVPVNIWCIDHSKMFDYLWEFKIRNQVSIVIHGAPLLFLKKIPLKMQPLEVKC